MRTKDAINWAGGTQQKLADKLGCSQSVVAEWGEHPTAARQLQIQVLSLGRLRAEDWALRMKKPPEQTESA